jgi:hypothetical protein
MMHGQQNIKIYNRLYKHRESRDIEACPQESHDYSGGHLTTVQTVSCSVTWMWNNRTPILGATEDGDTINL